MERATAELLVRGDIMLQLGMPLLRPKEANRVPNSDSNRTKALWHSIKHFVLYSTMARSSLYFKMVVQCLIHVLRNRPAFDLSAQKYHLISDLAVHLLMIVPPESF